MEKLDESKSTSKADWTILRLLLILSVCNTLNESFNRSGRFSHSMDYINKLAENRFSVLQLIEIVPRMEDKNPVHGYLVILRRL